MDGPCSERFPMVRVWQCEVVQAVVPVFSYEMGERPPLSSVLAEMGLELVCWCVLVCVRVWPACLLGCPFTVTVKGWRAAWGCGMNGVCER